jgi:hypothetical protein
MCGPVVYPPVVTLSSPSYSGVCDPVGTVRTFTASSDQVATMSVYLDSYPGSSSPVLEIANVQQISYTAPQFGTVGVHHIYVVAENENGSGMDYWTWSLVETPPVVTRVDPEEQSVSDLVGTQRRFTASCDQSATLIFKLDNDLVYESSPGVRNASYINNSASAGTHEIEVIATNSNGDGSNHWNWLLLSTTNPPVVTRYDPAEEDVDDLMGSSRTFTAAVDQPAIVRFYLGNDFDNPVFESDGFVELASYTNESAPLGTLLVTAVAENFNGTGDVSWNWNVFECTSGETKCVGYDLYACRDGQWSLFEKNSVMCGYPSPPPEISYDWACYEFQAKPGYEIYAIYLSVNINDLPFQQAGIDFVYPGDSKLLVPNHAYLYTDHSLRKGAIGRYKDQVLSGKHVYTVFGVYFDDSGEPEDHIEVECGLSREQRIELIPNDNILQAYAEDDFGVDQRIGRSTNITENEIVHIDFMAEIQWIETMTLPEVGLNENSIIVTNIETNQGSVKPNICLELTDNRPNPRQGTWARISMQIEDDKFIFNFGLER